jgi:type I protein arginine methyltransferase
MGYFLLYESFVYDVIKARDKLLKPGGIMLPNRLRMNVSGFKDSNETKLEKVSFWQNVYGVDMSCLGRNALIEPSIEAVNPDDICTDICNYFTLDMQTCTADDCEYANTYKVKVLADSRIDALVVWFDVDFNHEGLQNKQTFSTGPYTMTTHWKQTVFWIDGEYTLERGDTLEGTIACKPNPKHRRELDVKISFIARDSEGVQIGESYTQHYIMT